MTGTNHAHIADLADLALTPEPDSSTADSSLAAGSRLAPVVDIEAAKLRLAQLSARLLSDIPYCPWTPNRNDDNTPNPQQLFLLDFGKEAMYGGAAGGGKMLECTEILPTPTGWVAVGDVVPGDELFDETGQPCSVTHVFPVDNSPESYRLTFDDGSTVNACADHQWLTYDAKELVALSRRNPEFRVKRRANRPSRATGNRSEKFTAAVTARNLRLPTTTSPAPTGTVRTTKQIAESLLTPRGRRNHAIPVAGPLDLPHRDLPLDPYVFGLWLGDGSKASGSITTMDPETVAAVEAAGYPVEQRHDKEGNKASTFRFTGLREALDAIGVRHNKHVPPVYLRSSIEQRLALLQGLMDTDGTVATNSGSAEFCNTNKAIIDATYELITSLGWRATVREGRATLYGVDKGPKWTIKWMADRPVFRLARKLALQRFATRRTTRFRYIVACDPIEPVPMRCLSVDSPSHLFLATRSMIPTHNSIALLMAASQFLDVPGYSALLLRKSFRDLEQPLALMDIAEQWWGGQVGCKFEAQERTWYFSCGRTRGGNSAGRSRISFSYLEKENDRYRYQGGGYHMVGFDELTQHKERDYRYLFSRMRRVIEGPLSRVPIRMRATTNPGGIGHEWVHRRFIAQWERWKKGLAPKPVRNFHPAMLADNHKLDQDDYIESMMNLDPVTRAQLLRGDWNIRPDGRMFKRRWFKPIRRDEIPYGCRWIRFWDMAATEENRDKEPDYTAGALVGRTARGQYVIADMRHWRQEPAMNDLMCKATGLFDTRQVAQVMEQEPGSAGKTAIHHFRTQVFDGLDFRGLPSTGSKIQRAAPTASQADAGNVLVVDDGSWDLEGFLNEVEIFPDGLHDDRVDAMSGAFGVLARAAMFGVQIGESNEEFEREKQWRPDVTPHVAPTFEAVNGVDRIAMAREAERQMEVAEREAARTVAASFSLD